MNEIIFLVENAIEAGYTARGLGESVYTEGDDLDELSSNIRDAGRLPLRERREAAGDPVAFRQ